MLLFNNLHTHAAEGQSRTRWQSRFPENPDAYVPVPMPVPRSDGIELFSGEFENRLVSYDTLTGRETILEIDRDNIPKQTSTKSNPGIGAATGSSDIGLFRFTELSKVDNPQDYPWRANCKLFFRKGNNYYTGTGVLIDPLHVITAGHCVHGGAGEGWASDMIVIPAYQDEASPYGDAYGVSLHAWTAWKNLSSSDDDIGLIKLDRPIGAVTGWHGYSYNNNLIFYLSNNFQSAGYPAAEPYHGELMYYWQGRFDYGDFDASSGRWLGNEVAFSPSAYGGQSGSGVYLSEGTNNVIYAIVSNIFGGYTYCPRITGNKFGEITRFIDANTPSNFDLMPLNVTVTPQNIPAGEQLTSVSYTIHNYSSVPFSGTINADIYLSYDDNISTSDIFIGTETFSQSIGSKESKVIDVQVPLSIPPGMAKGQYRIGVILNIDDFNIVNNDSDGQEAAEILVGVYKLSNDEPEVFFDASMEFALTINGRDWSCIAISPYEDQDIETDFFPDFSDPYGISMEDGLASDFIAVNGHGLGDTVHYARLLNSTSESAYVIEAQWQIPDIYLGTTFDDSISNAEIFQMYEVPLYSGQRCNFRVHVTSGDADLALYGISARYGWGSRTYTDWIADRAGPGRDEYILITSDFTGYYAIVIVNENAGSAEYTITAIEN